MDLLGLGSEIIIVSVTGALSPGPLTFATLSEGRTGGWRDGFKVAVGHMAVELPLVILLTLGLGTVISRPAVRAGAGLLGGAFLMYYALLQLRSLRAGGDSSSALPSFSSPYLLGAALSGLNPFFLLWWATIGAKLIVDSLTVIPSPAASVAFLYPLHVWLDYAWLSFVAWLGWKGRELGDRATTAMSLVFSAIMIYFGVVFLLEGLRWLGLG